MTKRHYILPAFLIAFFLLFFFGQKILTVFSPILAALILTYIASPFVNFMSERMPKIVAAILFYALITGLLVSLVAFIMPTFLSAIESFIAYLPALYDKISSFIPSSVFSEIISYLSIKADNVSLFIKDAFSFLVSSAFALVLSCFFLMDTSSFKKGIYALFPERITDKFIPVVREIDAVFKGFFRGQVLVSAFLTGITFILLLILGVKHALVLSLIYGIFCFIPTIGPFLGGVPIVLIAYLSSPLSALLSLAAVLLTQFVENTFLSPKIKADSVDISPASAFIAVYLGAAFFGFPGVIFGIPVLASIKIILRRLLSAIS
ncbi:MAG: AI-2E family transporter [Clostridia bacterium]|nr:AI-2E family transporter [Clostridia bacterium]